MWLIRKLIAKYERYYKPLAYAKNVGVSIGTDCKLNGSPIWGSEPWLVSIGNHTEISFDVAFITHDGATWVFRNSKEYQGVLKFGKIKIGNNCFIGARSTILPSVEIGDDCVIGAGSLVNKSIPSGEVWGVPAKRICTTKEYADKCLIKAPKYDRENFRHNKREEVLRMLELE